MIKYIILLISIILCLSCDKANFSNDKSTKVKNAEINEIQSNYDNKNLNEVKGPDNRKIIWVGEIEMQVKNVDQFTRQLNATIKKNEAFISEMRTTNNSYNIATDITIRVKNENFTKLINDVKSKSGNIDKLEISSDDVTEEYIDIKSRLETKKDVRDRYIKLLKSKTGKISEIIEAEEAIRKITEEIEAKEGRLRYLNDKISFSTLNLRIYQKVDYKPKSNIYKQTFWDKTKDGLENGWEIITGLVLILINIWPIVIITIVVFIKRKWFRKKIFSKKEQK